MRIQIHGPQSLLTLGIVLVNATWVLGSQLNPTNTAGQCGEMLNRSINEAPAQRFDRSFEGFIQTDAPINPGNSGGALVDVTGRLIGINTAILSNSGGNLGIGFAVPSDLARRVMTDLVKFGHVVRGYLGVETQDLTPRLAKEFKLHGVAGVLVGGVVPNGPAEKAGLEVGDVITRFDGQDVHDSRRLKLSVAEIKPGQSVPIEVLRDGSAKPLRVTIGNASGMFSNGIGCAAWHKLRFFGDSIFRHGGRPNSNNHKRLLPNALS